MKNVIFDAKNVMSFESLLEKNGKVLIGLECFDDSAIFFQFEFGSSTPCKNRKFLLKNVKNLGVGGWCSEHLGAKTLQEWKQYFQDIEHPFDLIVFENEKEMYQWMLEKVKSQT